MIDYNVGDRVESVNSGYIVETGPLAFQPVKYGTITEFNDDGSADIHWYGCDEPYFENDGRFKAIKPYREPREFWIVDFNVTSEKPDIDRLKSEGYTVIHVREVIE